MNESSTQPKTDSKKLTQFQKIDINILLNQNHNLFQYVNQLNQQIKTLKKAEVTTTTNTIPTQYAARIVQYMLHIVQGQSQSLQKEQLLIPSKHQKVDPLLSEIFRINNSDEQHIKASLKSFIEGFHVTFNNFCQKQISELHVESASKAGKNFLVGL